MTEEKEKQQLALKKVSGPLEKLVDCQSEIWRKVSGLTIETSATPLANQPSPYIKSTYDEKKIGAVKKITIKGVYTASDIAFCLEWKSERPNLKIEDINIFPDGIAILWPFKDPEETPIKEMGAKDYPTNSWYWRPDFEEKPKNQVAHGLSTSLYTEESSLISDSKWENGSWRVVMGRPRKVKEEAVNFKAGTKTAIGFAVWEGANGERGGVKAFSNEWRDLILES